MSRIGKQPIEIPENVEVKIEAGLVTVKGPKGELREKISSEIKVEKKDKQILLSPISGSHLAKALWGTYRSLIANMVKGVVEGYEKQLEIQGVGYRAKMEGPEIVLNLGHSHPIKMKIPDGLEVKVDKNIITVSGTNKQQVGQLAARIRSQRKPEPYKGKGVRYVGEIVKIKAGKKAAGTE